MGTNTLRSTLSVALDWLNAQPLSVSTLQENAGVGYDNTQPTGTASGEADQAWGYTGSLSASGSQSFTLSALTESVYGSTVTLNMVKVKAIVVVNLSTTSGQQLLLAPAASHPFEAPWNAQAAPAGNIIGPNSPLVLADIEDGWATTSGSADTITLSNPSADTIEYAIAVLGTSA